MDLQNTKELVEVALGKREADLILKNSNLINIFSGEVYKVNIYIYDKYIAKIIESDFDSITDEDNIVDIDKNFISLCFASSNSKMDIPLDFTKDIVPKKDKINLVADLYKINDFLGVDGIEHMLQNSKRTSNDEYSLFPSYVANALAIENNWAVFDKVDVQKILYLLSY